MPHGCCRPGGCGGVSSRAIDRIWLTHRSHGPGKIVVNWETEQAGDSVARYGLSEACEWVVRRDESVRLHHVEIPLPRKGVRYPDPHSTFIASEDNYILLTLTRRPPRMVVELKNPLRLGAPLRGDTPSRRTVA